MRVKYMMQSQIITLGYFSAVAIAIVNVPYDPVAMRIQVFAALIMIDLLCIFVVHMFEMTPQVLAVVNSRICFCIGVSALNIITVVAYKSSIQVKIPFYLAYV